MKSKDFILTRIDGTLAWWSTYILRLLSHQGGSSLLCGSSIDVIIFKMGWGSLPLFKDFSIPHNKWRRFRIKKKITIFIFIFSIAPFTHSLYRSTVMVPSIGSLAPCLALQSWEETVAWKLPFLHHSPSSPGCGREGQGDSFQIVCGGHARGT